MTANFDIAIKNKLAKYPRKKTVLEQIKDPNFDMGDVFRQVRTEEV